MVSPQNTTPLGDSGSLPEHIGPAPSITAAPHPHSQSQSITSSSESDSEHGDSKKDKDPAIASLPMSLESNESLPAAAAAPPSRPWYSRLNPLKWSEIPPIPTERTVCPEYNASLFSKLTFQWMSPIMDVGYRRPLELQDIWLVNPDRKIDVMADKFHANLKLHIDAGVKNPLLWAIHDTFKREFWFGGICLFIASICQVMSPFTLRYLIEFVQDAYNANLATHDAPGKNGPPVGLGLGIVFGIMALQFLQSVGTNQFIYHGFMVGGQARAVLITAIFEKTMRISAKARAEGILANPKDAKPLPEPKKMSDKEKAEFAEKFLGATPENGGGVKMPKLKQKENYTGNQPWSNGRIMNLMATDTSRIDQACGMFHLIWTSPFTILLTLIILLINLTYSALAGFGMLFLGLPILVMAIKSLITRRKSINRVTDLRVSLINEILKSIRFVKYYGWEAAFLDRLVNIRRQEITMTQILLTARNGINAFSFSLPIFASMLSFITYSVTGHPLTAARVFSSLALFSALRVPFNLLPVVIGQVTDAWTSLRRIQEFLMAEDVQDDIKWNLESGPAIELEKASFTWEQSSSSTGTKGDDNKSNASKDSPKELNGSNEKVVDGDASSINDEAPFALNDISLAVGRKELIAVIGTVGSGKSSLLAGLAGDMRATGGNITLGASRAFCPQHAWIQNTTLRENILFGKPMDRPWYDAVVRACALQPDLDMLPAGDKTEIGERGINISGGQKQRLNLARAIYSNSDIVLMDDPLSAVDAHVGRHIFEKAICGLLSDRCRVLATHQLHVLGRCDRVVWLEQGKVRAVDTFKNLAEKNAGFQALIATIAQREEDEPEHEKVVNPEAAAPADKQAVVVKAPEVNAQLMQEEERAINSVPLSIYTQYIRASGSIWNGIIPIALLLLSQGSNVATSLWLSYWTANRFDITRNQYIGIYVGLACLQALLIFAFSGALSILGTRASKTMFDRALGRILHAPISFFDTTPLGRIMNRFSKDVEVMDNTLTDALRQYMFTLAMITSVFTLFVVFFHYSGIALGPMLILFVFAAAYYRASAREVKRHEAVLRSTMFARFSEAITGIPSIRAYGLQSHFTQVLRGTIDDLNSAYYLTFSNQRWLNTRLDVVSNLLVVTTGILVVTLRYTIDPSISGLVFSYMLSIVQMVQLLVRQMAEVENSMNATERLHYYGRELDQEPLNQGTASVTEAWPPTGEIKFDNVEMRYRAGLPLVLKGVDLSIKGGERLAIIGRTGAGKSSITAALFRLTELSGGSISIDGIDIAKTPLQDLRSRLSIIPQDPALFQGTVRSNLDPFEQHTDLELWSALRQAHLVAAEDTATGEGQAHAIGLDSGIEEDGLNFSLGQRQLLALARALVRNSKIVVCDEATSSVDVETDGKIQETIRTSFRGKTLLFIAHRLKTVITYDRVCVMDAGKVVELGTPRELWDQGTVFRGMCEQSGIVEADLA